jgi:hypothetical protein
MSKNTNLSFLTDFLTADIVNSRVGMNNVSPQSTFDVTGTGKFSGILTLGSTVSNGTYTYTLPSATGTLALTSDIPVVTGYVPYTGATTSVDLGNNVLTSRGLNIDSIGGTAGALNLRQATSFSTWSGAPFTSIYATTGNRVVFSFSNDNRSFTLDGSIVSAASPRTFTFPDASGTLALTSNLSSYLPLTGGTLTGALNGTSATFTGGLTVNNPSTSSPLELNNTVTSNYVFLNSPVGFEAMTRYYNPTAGNWYTGIRAVAGIDTTASYHIFSSTYGADVFALNTNGAATFASSVTAVGDITSSNGKFFVVNTYGYFFGGNSNLTGWQGSNGTQIIQGFTGGTEKIRITSGGEVNIGGFANVFPVLTVKGIASSPHIGSTWSVSANQDGIGRTIIGTAGQGRSMYFENNGDIVIPNNSLQVGTSMTAGGLVTGGGTNYLTNTSTGSGATYQRIFNTGGDVIFGINNSTGGSLLPGAAGYATVLYNNSNTDISFGTYQLERMRITSSGAVGINSPSPTAKFHAYGTTKLENYFYYGYAQSFVWQSSFNNPVQSLFTFNAGAAYSQTLIKVTFIQNGVSNGYAARYVGYALAHLNPFSFNSSVTAMAAEYTNGPAAPTLSWSGQTLQITPQRITNYDGYVVILEWGSNINTNALPTVTM